MSNMINSDLQNVTAGLELTNRFLSNDKNNSITERSQNDINSLTGWLFLEKLGYFIIRQRMYHLNPTNQKISVSVFGSVLVRNLLRR